MKSDGSPDSAAAGYQHLEARPHPWRKQLYLKGHAIGAGELIASMASKGWDADCAAANLGIEREAVLEALRYAQTNRAVLDADERADYAHTQGWRLA